MPLGKRFEPYPHRKNVPGSGQGSGVSLGPPGQQPKNNTLQLKKVPPHNNNITHLNDHFSKFGKIVNILVS